MIRLSGRRPRQPEPARKWSTASWNEENLWVDTQNHQFMQEDAKGPNKHVLEISELQTIGARVVWGSYQAKAFTHVQAVASVPVKMPIDFVQLLLTPRTSSKYLPNEICLRFLLQPGYIGFFLVFRYLFLAKWKPRSSTLSGHLLRRDDQIVVL